MRLTLVLGLILAIRKHENGCRLFYRMLGECVRFMRMDRLHGIPSTGARKARTSLGFCGLGRQAVIARYFLRGPIGLRYRSRLALSRWMDVIGVMDIVTLPSRRCHG
ncbi:hypothetical protein GCM10009304_08620 [Pseudomonas matsuisoli]|uniref:Uncharacterized protein n=1 Tax=Pseudomonas matsuisoli TaxID=1515666 RepID=A0A917PMP3_9PSED|nr:hypothetical protein GCM10009304_08620 [Pseudomonas matsuisoli]